MEDVRRFDDAGFAEVAVDPKQAEIGRRSRRQG
jgi:hypothetical protein